MSQSLRPSAAPLRWVRGTVVGSVASTLAWLGHSVASGMTPEPAALVWTTACAVPVAVALSARRWGLPSLLTLLLGAQVVFHLAFADMAPPMGHHMSGGHAGTVMVLAHVSSALVTALVLRRGEDWVLALVGLLTSPWKLLRTAGSPLPRGQRHDAVPLLSRCQDLLFLSGSQPRRGPPVPVV